MSLQEGELQGRKALLLLQMAVVQHSMQRVPRVRESRLQPVYQQCRRLKKLGALK